MSVGVASRTGALIAQPARSVPQTTTAPRQIEPASSQPVRAASRPATERAGTAHAALVKKYCITCHNDRMKPGGVTLTAFDAAHIGDDTVTAEKMIKKLRLDMMPPPGMPRPERAVLVQFASALENTIDAAAALAPHPGQRLFPRLTRSEYARSVRDLLDLDVDVNAFLPPDTMSAGFDNVSDVQSFSPMLQEGFLRAAATISNLALGDRNATATEATYKIARGVNQMRHIEGTPWGTRGGLAFKHTFPADGEYTFRVLLYGTTVGVLFGNKASRAEQLEVSVDGERAALLDIDYRMREEKDLLTITTPRVHIKSGQRTVAAAFIQKFDGVIEDIPAPIDYTLVDGEYGDDIGVTSLPHLRDFSITGPLRVTGISDTPSRRKVFSCRPLSPTEDRACARRILLRLATEAYRRPATEDDLDPLLRFYDEGRKGGDFEAGIKLALRALLASPHFLFRVDALPPGVKPGQNYRVSDLNLASRLSYFIWGGPPDAALLKVAAQGTLRTRPVLEKQVRRMMADPRAEAMATRFGSQYLKLQAVSQIQPDGLLFPSFDDGLAVSFRRETELLFENIVREDRDVLELLTADYTFINERIAKVYRIPNVASPHFRRVSLTDTDRRGILGHGSILLLTSVADRTAPVLRGKYIMETLLGSPPPPPPPNTPTFEQTNATSSAGKPLSVRERMEQHRKNPACNSCHRFIDPLGLSLESYDAMGAARIRDNGALVDTAATLWDGTPLTGPADLRASLLRFSEPLLRNFTERLLAYALGRRAEAYDQPTVRAIVRKARQEGNRFSAFVLGVATSPAFQMMQTEPGLTESRSTGPTGSAR